jgi:RHS repeat-associated protein
VISGICIPANTITTVYDLQNRVTNVSDTYGNTLAMAYDNLGRKTSQTDTSPTLSAKTVSYQYDAAGNRTRLTWPDGYYAAYGYDAVNHPTTVIDSSGTTLATYGYDNLARRAALQFSGTTGAKMLTSWSAENDLLTLSNDLAGTANDAGYTHTFTPAHQWATSSISNAAFKYTPPTGTTTAYGGANSLNQVSTIGGTAMAYDTRGNLTTDGTTGTTYLYDAENHMMSATRSGATSTYAYDPLGRRTAKTVSASTTSFVYDGDAGIADYGGGTLARRFVPGPDIDNYIATVSSSGAIKFYHTDKMGSIVAMSDVNGNLAEGPYVYDAYGNCFSAGAACSAGVGFRYTGQRLDPETGLYYYRARYYQPGIGQFLQTDPVGYKDNLDLYSYVGDDPTDATDPSGLMLCGGSGQIVHCEGSIEQKNHNGTKGSSLPPFKSLWKNNVYSQTGVSDTYNSIGGQLKGAGNYMPNACVARLCDALTRSGQPIDHTPRGTFALRGANGHLYLVRVTDMDRYMTATYGRAPIDLHGDGIHPIDPSSLKGIYGIIEFRNNFGTGTATGHFDLYRGTGTTDGCRGGQCDEFVGAHPAYEVKLWPAPAPY